jgi:hypothetical protein
MSGKRGGLAVHWRWYLAKSLLYVLSKVKLTGQLETEFTDRLGGKGVPLGHPLASFLLLNI